MCIVDEDFTQSLPYLFAHYKHTIQNNHNYAFLKKPQQKRLQIKLQRRFCIPQLCNS